ncbi:MAG: tRNA (guanosine(37)-N1)-methyltransferase TrmD [Candidatus Saccharimonadia bacterium]
MSTPHLHLDIITLFPDMFRGPFDMSMIKKAQDNGLVSISLIDLRTYGLGARRQVDDTVYGGGDGMLLKPEPMFTAIEEAKAKHPAAKVIILSPQGVRYSQRLAQELSQESALILVAGHYEGFDERILSIADFEISVGDYVLTGGEIPAMTITDSVIRLIPGVLGGDKSSIDESFSGDLLEYPQYTRPVEFRGMRVPDVLQNGNHAEIARWRKIEAEKKTSKNRPDLLK